MDTLWDFLLARIAEDEDAARAAGGEQWWHSQVPGPTMRKSLDEPTKTVLDSPGSLISYEMCRDEFAEHAANFDPARVLAECEAKRQIVERFKWAAEDPDLYRDDMAIRDQWQDAWDTLTDAAAIYADHPDYREEWKP